MTEKNTRIYVVRETGQTHSVRMVRATSQAQAIAHVTKPRFAAAVATPEELVKLTMAKIEVEDASAAA